MSVVSRSWCNNNYTEVVDLFNKTLARFKSSNGKFNVMIVVAEANCYYCHNKIKDYDETGVDCGGSCISCSEKDKEKITKESNNIYKEIFNNALAFLNKNLGKIIIFAVVLALLIAGLFLVGLKRKRDMRKINEFVRSYNAWKARGYDVSALKKDFEKMTRGGIFKHKWSFKN